MDDYFSFDDTPQRTLLILGAGGLGQDVAEIAQLSGHFTKVAFLDDDTDPVSVTHKSRTFHIEGRLEEAEHFVGKYTHAIPAFANNEMRLRMIRQLMDWGYEIPRIIHPRAYVSSVAKIGKGCIIRGNAYIGRDVNLGVGCLVNIGAMIDHGCLIGNGVHLGMGCVVRNEVTIEALTIVEHNTVVQ